MLLIPVVLGATWPLQSRKRFLVSHRDILLNVEPHTTGHSWSRILAIRYEFSIARLGARWKPDPDLPCAIDKPRAGSDIPMFC